MRKSGSMEKEVATATGEPLRGWRQDPLILSFSRLIGLFRRSPALMLSCSYLSIGLMGLLYNAFLLWKFDFNVLPYLELSDVLLATLHYPQMLLWLLLSLSVLLLVSAVGIWLRYRRAREHKVVAPVWFWLTPLLIIYLGLAALVSAKNSYDEVRAGQGQWYRVQLSYPLYQSEQQKRAFLPRAQFVTRTSSYLFMIYEGQLTVLPHGNISALEPLSTPAAAPAAAP